MKKQTIQKILLLVMPLLVVLIASNPTGVMIFDGETVSYATWLETVPESNLGWCAPVAALLNYLLFGLAVVYALSAKKFCLKGIFLIALAAVCTAVLPIVVQSDLKIVPNAFGSICLGIQAIAARVILNGNADWNGKQSAEKLPNRR